MGAIDCTINSAQRIGLSFFDAIFSRNFRSHPLGEIMDFFPFLESLYFYDSHKMSVFSSLDLGLLQFSNCSDLEIGRRIILSHPVNAQPLSPPSLEKLVQDGRTWPLPQACAGAADCKLSQRPVTRPAGRELAGRRVRKLLLPP